MIYQSKSFQLFKVDQNQFYVSCVIGEDNILLLIHSAKIPSQSFSMFEDTQIQTENVKVFSENLFQAQSEDAWISNGLNL